jgi:protein-disulfide isomerase
MSGEKPRKRGGSQSGQHRASRLQKLVRKYWLTIGVILALLVAAGGYTFWPRPEPAGVTTTRLEENPSIGPSNAPVTIVEYGDFGCTTCRAWFKAGIQEQVLAHYGDQVRFVWKDFPIITAQSPKAAEAGQCAFDQGKFWPYHDLLYNRAPALSVSDLKSYAAELGLDTAEFNRCLDSGRYQAKVNQSLQEAYKRGFQGTPSFLVNNQPLAGPPSFETLKNLIDPILAANKSG